jgi:hypothetical protein
MFVLARAYADRPLRRIVSGKRSRVTYLVNPSTVSSTGIEQDSGVGFPDACVFAFDPVLFHKLEEAWNNGDGGRLSELWAEATPLRDPDKIAA